MALVHSQSVRPHGFVIFVIVCIDFCESGALSLVQHRPVKLIKFLISVRICVMSFLRMSRRVSTLGGGGGCTDVPGAFKPGGMLGALWAKLAVVKSDAVSAAKTIDVMYFLMCS